MQNFLKSMAFIAILLIGVCANAQQTLDQSNTTTSTNTGLSPNTAAGQIFKAGITGNLTQIDIRLFSSTSAATNTFNVVVYNATATTVNTASIVSTTTFSNIAISTSPGWYTMPIASATPLIAGNYYAFVINNASSSNTLIYDYESTGSYANGAYVFNYSAFTPLNVSASSDIGFKTFVTPPPPLLNLGVGTATPDASAKLDVTSTTQGILVPRMTTTARNAIATPAKGLMVYDSTLKAFYYHDGAAWAAVGGAGGGATLQLVATKTTGSQILANANGTNTGDLVTFNNVVTTPTSGTYNTTTNAYTASVAGLYFIQASSRCDDNTTATNTINQFLYVDINGGGLSSVNNILPIYPGQSAGNMPAGSKGRGYVSTMVYLNANDVVTIKGLSANSSTAGTALKTDGSTRFMVIKLN